MSGHNEKKLALKVGETIHSMDVFDEVRKILGSDVIAIPKNVIYRDTYYDDSELSLFKQGGSLKLREGVLDPRNIEKSLIMRARTQYPTKVSVTPWDIAEVTALQNVKEFADTFKPLKGLFPTFNFDKINKNPVLVCTTIRTEYVLILDENKTIKLLFDHINYEKDDQYADDYVLKIRSKTVKSETIETIYCKLLEKFEQYEMIRTSRYERALEKLSATH